MGFRYLLGRVIIIAWLNIEKINVRHSCKHQYGVAAGKNVFHLLLHFHLVSAEVCCYKNIDLATTV